MPKLNLTLQTIPFAVERALKRLGANVSYARRRRALTQQALARKAGVTPVTLRRVERGSPTTAIGAYFAALWALGLERELADIASPDRDEEGKTLERARAPERIRPRSAELDDNF